MKTKKISNGVFYIAISLVAVLAIGSVAVSYSGEAPEVIMETVNIETYNEATEIMDSFAAASGPNKYFRQYFHAGFQGGGTPLATSSTASTYTLLASEFDQNVNYIEWNAGLNITLTTMASTTMRNMVGNDTGDWREYDFYSATTTEATTITFAPGTGIDMQETEGSDLVVNGLEHATIKLIRKADSDILWILNVNQTD